MRELSRRELLKSAGIGTAAVALAACQPQVVKETVVVETEKIVRETVVVDAAAAKAAAMKGEISWAFRADIELPWVEERTETFAGMYPDTSVKQVVLARSDMYPKMYAMHAAGDLPDVCFFYHSHYQLWRAIENGVLMELDDQLEADRLDLDEWFPTFIDMCWYKGHFYGLPSWGWSGHDCLTVNNRVFEELGLEPPGPTSHEYSMETIAEWARKFHKPGAGPGPAERFGMSINPNHEIRLVILCRAFDGYMLNEEGTKCMLLEDEGAREAMGWLYDLHVTDPVTPTAGEVANVGTAWAEGRVAMYMTGSLGVLNADKAIQNREVTEVGNILFPRRADGQIPSQLRGGSWNVSARSKMGGVAWEFIKHLSGKEGTLGFNLLANQGALVRPDVMPMLKGKSPVYGWFEENLMNGMKIHPPWNSRGTEFHDAVRQNSEQLFDRKAPMPFEQGLEQLNDAIQDVLELPLA